VTLVSPPRALALALAAALAILGGCSGGDHGSAQKAPLPAALSYIPKDSGLVVVVPTDLRHGPLRRLDRLVGSGGLRRRVRGMLASAGFDFDLLAGQLGSPLAFAPLPSGDLVAALRVKDGAALRQTVEQRIAAGRATQLGAHKGALRWRESARAYLALRADDLVAAPNEKELDQALDTANGSDSLAYDRSVTATLDRLGSGALVRAAGDAQRLLDRDPVEASELRRIPWLAALGAIEVDVRVDRGGANVEALVRSDRRPLSDADLPLRPGAEAPVVDDLGAGATLAVLEPDRLARFLERSVSVIDPDSYGTYRAAVGELRSLFGIDVHRDLLEKMKSVSISLASGTAASFVARLLKGAGPAVKRTLTRAEPALEYAFGLLLRGTSIVERGSSWQVRRGRLVLARYAVRGDLLVGSVGLGGLPSASGGRRLTDVKGSLALRGDLAKVGNFLALVLDFPRKTLAVTSALGKLTLGVQTRTSGLVARGRLAIGRK
jgi:hypothetical protein